MQRLIAIAPILYGNTQYEPGDELPTNDRDYAEAWLDNASAIWKDDEAEQDEETPAKAIARPRTARAGRTGIAAPSSGAETDLVGRVPDPEKRGVIKEPSKRAPKRAD